MTTTVQQRLNTGTIALIKEPGLVFRHGQVLNDPRDGLSLFGPFDTELPSHPRNITYGVIGTTSGIAAFREFAGALSQAHFPEPEPGNPRLWPAFPGFEEAFLCHFPSSPSWQTDLDESDLLKKSRHKDPNRRAFEVVNLYDAALEIAAKRDEPFGLIFCIVPDEIWLNCRPLSYPKQSHGGKPSGRELLLRIRGIADIFGDYDPQQYQLAPDFRQQLKARAMRHGIPVQIMRESTLDLRLERPFGERDLTPLSDRAWNLSTAIYYKSGGKPWRLATAREGVSYVGLAFRKTKPDVGNRSAVCAAQMFVDTGDGVVFLGDEGLWYSPEERQYHLDPNTAAALLRGVLKTYEDLDGRALIEVFLHSRSDISREEFDAYREVCPSGVKLTAIRVRLVRDSLRLYREGTRPVLRGTLLTMSQSKGFLWASGFKDELGTYDGWETPAPLSIDIQHGECGIEQVAADILGLTKLNYNACRLGEATPVTIGYSDGVGEILVSNPGVKNHKPQFKFYI